MTTPSYWRLVRFLRFRGSYALKFYQQSTKNPIKSPEIQKFFFYVVFDQYQSEAYVGQIVKTHSRPRAYLLAKETL